MVGLMASAEGARWCREGTFPAWCCRATNIPHGLCQTLGKRSQVLILLSLGVSLVPCLLHAPAKCIPWLQTKPEQEGSSHLPALPPHQILACCLTPGEQLGLSHCLEQEPECSCHA